MAARASAAVTGSTTTGWSPTTLARATTAPPKEATVEPSASSATDIGVSSGGGWRSATRIVGHERARLSGQSWGTRAARAPAVQPPLPDEGGPQKRLGTRRGSDSLIP